MQTENVPVLSDSVSKAAAQEIGEAVIASLMSIMRPGTVIRASSMTRSRSGRRLASNSGFERGRVSSDRKARVNEAG